MQIYITKNNQQLGPFEEAEVLEMLENGKFSPTDLAIRHGETEWQKLETFYPNVRHIADTQAAATVEQPAPKKSRKGLLLGCGGFFLIGLLVLSVLGFLGYRNMYPEGSLEDLPDSVNNLKLNTRYPPKGNIWGNETTYVGLYDDESKTQTVIYLMTVFADKAAAEDAYTKGVADSCKAGETVINFSFVDQNDKEISKGGTCAAPLYIIKDNKLVTLGGPNATGETLMSFAENLPFNEGAKLKRKE